jgi:hypothetical protein
MRRIDGWPDSGGFQSWDFGGVHVLTSPGLDDDLALSEQKQAARIPDDFKYHQKSLQYLTNYMI